MREIKFRAWDKKNKRMSRVNQWNFEFGDLWVEANEEDWENEPDFEIMQYTGLKDKNGKEIYEGDLIRTDGFSDGLSVPVVWRNCMFQMGEHGISPLYPRKDYEVIGNIYENPELIKESC